MLFIVLAILTMLVGNLYALVQTNVKRMLAYSSIAHAGYLLAGLGAMGWTGEPQPGYGVLVYLAAYTFMNLGAFGVLAYLKTAVVGQVRLLAQAARRAGPPLALGGGPALALLAVAHGHPGHGRVHRQVLRVRRVVWAGLWWLAVVGCS